jgi:carbamoyltransferase
LAAVLGVNAVFHDPAAALVIDGVTVAAAEEERFTRRKHGKSPVPFSTWELPEQAIDFCLRTAGIEAADLDAVGYSYDPSLAQPCTGDVTADAWEGLRTLYAERAELFLRSQLPGLRSGVLSYVPHHVAHAASAWGAAPFESCAVMVLDGRGERARSPELHGTTASPCSRYSSFHTASVCVTRSSPPTWGIGAAATSTR